MADGPKLYAGTTRANTDYHACRVDWKAEQLARGGQRLKLRPALCGQVVDPIPREWGEDRQLRQDSCRTCVKKVKAILDEEEKKRIQKGPLVAGYIRASTDKQVDSTDIQADIIRAYCSKVGLAQPVIYRDAAASGSQPVSEREAGARLMLDVRRGDHVIVARLDRISRNFLDFATILDSWNKMGVTLHPCDFPMGPIVPGDHLSQAFVYMLAVFAQYERKLIAQRTRETKAYLKSIDRHPGGQPPWGFRWALRKDGHRYLEINEEEAVICLKVLELSAKGYTTVAITKYLNEEWKIKNPRAGKYPDGKPIPRRADTLKDHPEGSFWQSKIHLLIAGGMRILKRRGQLPEGITPEEAEGL